MKMLIDKLLLLLAVILSVILAAIGVIFLFIDGPIALRIVISAICVFAGITFICISVDEWRHLST